MLLLLAAAAALLAPTATVQSPPTLCATALSTIDDQLKDIAYADISGLADDGSSPRATMRAAQQSAAMATIQANLAMMAGAHCPPPDFAISSHYYSGAAADCVTARGDEVREKCNRAAWTRKGP